MESQRVPPIQFNLVNESVNFGYNPILNNNNNNENENIENENIENENNMNTNDNTSDNNNYDPVPPTPPTPTLIDDTSPRTTNLMEQFSRVMSNVADDDDDDDVLNLPLDTEFDDFPRRENIFTPNQEKNEPLITYEQTEGENELNGDEGIINGEMVENKGNNKIGKKSTKGGNVTINNDEEMNVDEVDFDIWENDYIPPPPTSSVEMPTLITSLYGDNVPIQTLERTKLFEALPDYKENFNQESRPVELVVSKIPEEIVRARHRDIEANEAKLRNDQVMTAKLRERDLLWREHQARTRVENLETKSKTKLNNEVEKIYVSTKEREDLLGRQFRKAKEDMEEFLAKQEAYLQEVHGEVAPTQNLSRKYRVEWGKYPQPIEMRIRNLRACKNKLPKGAYVLLLTQYDQLGGNPLAWSKLGSYGIGSEYPASTKPVKHYGRYFDRVLKIDDSVFALCPPKKQLRPSNVFIIELFHLASRSNPTDHVVAWAALPIINAHFTVVEGKFRLPLIRGETNPTIKHFKSIEELIANDLNAWLCNIYIEIRHLPRSTLFEGSQVTKSEYEIEFDFMSKMLNIKNNEDKRNSDHSDNEDDDFHRALFYKKKAEVDVTMFNRKLHRRKLIKNTDVKDPSKDNNNNNTLRDSPRMHMLNAKGGGGASGWWSQALANRRGSKIAVENVPSSVISPITNGTENQSKIPEQIVDISSSDDEDDDKGEPNQILERSYAPGDEFFLHEFQKGKLPGVETLNSKTERQWAAAGIEGGKTIRRHQNDGPRLDSEAVPLQNENRLKKARDVGKDSWTSQLVEQRDYDEYTMSMAPDPGQQRRLLPRALMKSKLRYLYYEALGDLFPSQWGTLESHLATIIFIIAFWLRMYMHYIIQYLFLQIFNIPLYDFQLRIYEIMFKYMANSIPVSVEFGVVAIGPVANLAIFSIFVFMSMMFYKYGGYLPDSVSQFVAAYGVATFFDPLCILIIDLIKHNYNCSEIDDICRTDYTSKDCHCFTGDFVKLWKRMEHDENSGLTGLLMTLIAYTGTAIITALVLYEYMVYVHKNGRILDIWRRVTAPVEEFFIPHDFEISSAELTSIIARASLWRGANGSTRKVTISEYIEKDPYDINFVAMTKHYAIYEHELDGKRMLHRHFLMLSDGAIIEIFDQLSFDFSNQFKSLEKLLNVNSNKTNNHNNKNKPNIFDNFEITQK